MQRCAQGREGVSHFSERLVPEVKQRRAALTAAVKEFPVAEKRTVVICPNCRAKLGVREGVAKSHIACPRCQEEIPVVPAGHDAPPVEQLRRAAAAPTSGWSWWGFGGAIAAGSVWGVLLLAGGPRSQPFVSAVLGATCLVYAVLILSEFLGSIGLVALGAAETCSEELTGQESSLVDEASEQFAPILGGLCGLAVLAGGFLGWIWKLTPAATPRGGVALATAGVVVLGWLAVDFLHRFIQGQAANADRPQE